MPFLWQRSTCEDGALQNLPCCFTHSPSSLLFTAPGAAPLRWDSNAGGSSNSPTAVVSGLSKWVPTSSWMPPGMNEQQPVSHFNTLFYISALGPILLLFTCSFGVTTQCSLTFIPFGILCLSLLFKKDC